MILAHHGGELSFVLAALAGAGAVPPLILVVRAHLSETRERLRRRTLNG